MRKINQQGSILIVIIVSMLFTAVLAVGIYSLTSTSTYGGLMSNTNDNAYQMAKAGIRYAIETGGAQEGEFHMPDKNMMFTLARSGNEITSTGIVNQGSIFEARRVLRYTLAGVNNPVIYDFFDKSNIVGTSGAIVNDGTTITLGGSKNAIKQSYAAVWYSGNNTNANCLGGTCSFNLGLRVYFEFQVPADDGEGFTFAIISAINNTIDRVGGFSKNEYPDKYMQCPDASSRCHETTVAGGELLGYAGPGNTYKSDKTDGEGLRPPKMALQFDTYKQDPYKTIYLAGSRRDPIKNFVALMFWGDTNLTGSTPGLNYLGGGKHVYPLSSFDDNRWPDSDKPGQDGRKNGLGIVSYAVNDNAPRSCRIEITRSRNQERSGKYKYTINVWIDKTSSLNTLQKSRMKDVVVPFVDDLPSSSLRISNASAYFTYDEHAEFEKIFWGFTYGSGDAASLIPITNIIAFFPNTATNCAYEISPAAANHSSAAENGTVTITTSNDCYWLASSIESDNWLTLVSPPYGRGSGKLNYSISENAGLPRNGTIMIAGLPFNIHQEGSIVFDAYTIRNYTGNTIYRESGGRCSNSNRVNSGGSYNINNNSPGVTFHSERDRSSQCTGRSINITFEQAAQRDTNANGMVQINRSWTLTDY
jgi:hypothetical protein